MSIDQVQDYPYEAYNDGRGYEFTCICGEVRLITDDLNNETETVEPCTSCAEPAEAFKIVFINRYASRAACRCGYDG